jgi:hypothetical protein
MPPKFTTDRDPLLDCCRTADVRLCAHFCRSAAFYRCSEADIGSGQITCPACAKNDPSRESAKEAASGKTSGPCCKPGRFQLTHQSRFLTLPSRSQLPGHRPQPSNSARASGRRLGRGIPRTRPSTERGSWKSHQSRRPSMMGRGATAVSRTHSVSAPTRRRRASRRERLFGFASKERILNSCPPASL